MENETIESEKELEVAELAEVEEVSTDSVVVNSQEEPTAKKEESEAVEESSEEHKEADDHKQSDEENSKYAKARRKAEQESKAKSEEAYQKGLEEGRLAAFKGKVNPYTNTIIQDLEDLKVYEDMVELENSDKDPIADYGSFIADRNRRAAQEKLEREAREKKARQDIEEFSSKHPDINLTDLLNDEMFKDYAEGKNKSLCEMYDSFTKLQNSFRNKGIDTAKQVIANAQASPGSLNNAADNVIDYKTMSSEEFQRHVKKVIDGEEK